MLSLLNRHSKKYCNVITKYLIAEKYTSNRGPTVKRMEQEYKVLHDKANKEFNIPFGTDKAVLQYKIIDQTTGAVDLLHTEVPPSLQGKGIAKILAREALDHFASNDVPFKLTCWYLQKYFDENKKPEYVRNVIK